MTNSIYSACLKSLGGGEAIDVILDTTSVAPGTYFLYDTQYNYLSNYKEDFGGMMTEMKTALPGVRPKILAVRQAVCN